MKVKMSKTLAILMALVMVCPIVSATAFAEETKVAMPSQAFISFNLSDAALLELGYIKAKVASQEGADLFNTLNEDAEAVAHLDIDSELWVKETVSEVFGEVYYSNNDSEKRYVKWDDLQPVLENEPSEDVEVEREMITVELPIVYGDGLSVVYFNEETSITADTTGLEGINDIQYIWYYSVDGGNTWTEIAQSSEPSYSYVLTIENWGYRWKVEASFMAEVETDINDQEMIPSDESQE